MQDNAELLATAAAKFKAPAQELPEKIDHLGETVKRLEKELAEAKAKLAAKQGDEALSAAQDVNGVKVLLTTLEGIDAKTLRETMDKFKNKFGSAVIVLAVTGGDKAQLCAGVTKDLIGKVKAGELVNFVAAQCGGKGGGKPTWPWPVLPTSRRCRRRLKAHASGLPKSSPDYHDCNAGLLRDEVPAAGAQSQKGSQGCGGR